MCLLDTIKAGNISKFSTFFFHFFDLFHFFRFFPQKKYTPTLFPTFLVFDGPNGKKETFPKNPPLGLTASNRIEKLRVFSASRSKGPVPSSTPPPLRAPGRLPKNESKIWRRGPRHKSGFFPVNLCKCWAMLQTYQFVQDLEL